jgi:hypothetical protein
LDKIEEALPIAYDADSVGPKELDQPNKKRKITGSTNNSMETEKKEEERPLIPSNKVCHSNKNVLIENIVYHVTVGNAEEGTS